MQIEGHQRVLEHAVYTLANPVRAFLVATSRHWLGVSSVKMKYGVPVVVRRPQFGLWSGKAAHAKRRASRRSGRAAYAGRTKMPETAELVIDRPPIMPELSDEELRALVLEQLAEREQKIARERLERGIQVVGRSRCLAVHFLAIPKPEELFSRQPSFSASSNRERKRLAELRRRFLVAYYAARDRFLAGERDVVWPEGTWLMRVRFGLPCEAFGVT